MSKGFSRIMTSSLSRYAFFAGVVGRNRRKTSRTQTISRIEYFSLPLMR